MIFISHKLREVLEIADRVTVLRRGKKIDTVPTEGATEASLAKLMVGRDVLFRVEKDAARGGRRAARGRGPRGARRPRAARAARALAPRPRGRDRRHRGRRRQRPVRARRGDHGAARRAGRPRPRRGPRHHRQRRARRARRRRRPHRRGPPPARARAPVLARREPRAARLPARAAEPLRLALAEADGRSRPSRCSSSTTSAAASPRTLASSLSGGNQQKVVIARELAEEPKVTIAAQPTRGLDVGAIEFVHRRLLEQRDEGRGVLLVSLELEEIRSLSDRVLVIYEGRIVAELSPDASDEELAWRCSAGRCPRDADGVGRRGRAGAGHRRLAAVGLSRGAAGSSSRSITALFAFFVGGIVVALAGANPIDDLQGDLRRVGAELAVPVGDRRRPHARGAEPAADADPDHAADPHRARGRVRVPRRPVQHRRPGPVPRRQHGRGLGRLLVRGHVEPAAHRPGDRRGLPDRRPLGGDRRPAEGDHRAPTR